MTADIKLLPLPEGVDVIFSPDGNGAALDVFTAEQVQDYARACVAHATAPLQAEIEALRAEVGKRNGIDPWAVLIRAQEAEARAERLAEALRELVEVFSASGMYDAEVFDNARAALRDHDQEVGNGFWPDMTKGGGPDWTGFDG